jgi:hypothetical protein
MLELTTDQKVTMLRNCKALNKMTISADDYIGAFISYINSDGTFNDIHGNAIYHRDNPNDLATDIEHAMTIIIGQTNKYVQKKISTDLEMRRIYEKLTNIYKSQSNNSEVENAKLKSKLSNTRALLIFVTCWIPALVLYSQAIIDFIKFVIM